MLALALKYWKYILIALLALLQVVTMSSCSHTSKLLSAEKTAHQVDIQSYKNAQKAAEQLAADTKKRLEQESKVKADAADKSYASLYATYRANLLRYKAYQSVPSTTSGGQYTSPAKGPDRPGEGATVPAGQLVISLDDAGVCAENTARLQAARDWALSLPK